MGREPAQFYAGCGAINMSARRKKLNLLALDTTGSALSLAVQAGERRFFTQRRLGERAQDEVLIPAVNRLLTRAGLQLRDLDAIAAASGPGRFTGIRIGMAYAAVAAEQLGIPALAITLFEAIARKSSGRLVCSVVPGVRDEKYYRLFLRRKNTQAVRGAPVWVAANDWPRVRDGLERRGAVLAELPTTAADLLDCAQRLMERGTRPKFEPLYLKPAAYQKIKG